jgi:hypothetical protein
MSGSNDQKRALSGNRPGSLLTAADAASTKRYTCKRRAAARKRTEHCIDQNPQGERYDHSTTACLPGNLWWLRCQGRIQLAEFLEDEINERRYRQR